MVFLKYHLAAPVINFPKSIKYGIDFIIKNGTNFPSSPPNFALSARDIYQAEPALSAALAATTIKEIDEPRHNEKIL